MKTISAQTKISELIKENSSAIDAIASLAKPLEKLKNPILRKIMASRVTIAEAAKMSGVKVEDFERVLSPLGFFFENSNTTRDHSSTHNPRPSWLEKAPASHTVYYDVRPIIDNGADPLKEILHRFKEIEPGHILCIINSFVPTPLVHLLKQEKAEDAFVEEKNEKEFLTYFLKKGKQVESVPHSSGEKVWMDNDQQFEAIYSTFSDSQIQHIDVRHLEMPEPMQAIINARQDLPQDSALFVSHKRVPVYLLDELAEKEYEIHIRNVEDGDVKMLIFRRS